MTNDELAAELAKSEADYIDMRDQLDQSRVKLAEAIRDQNANGKVAIGLGNQLVEAVELVRAALVDFTGDYWQRDARKFLAAYDKEQTGD